MSVEKCPVWPGCKKLHFVARRFMFLTLVIINGRSLKPSVPASILSTIYSPVNFPSLPTVAFSLGAQIVMKVQVVLHELNATYFPRRPPITRCTLRNRCLLLKIPRSGIHSFFARWRILSFSFLQNYFHTLASHTHTRRKICVVVVFTIVGAKWAEKHRREWNEWAGGFTIADGENVFVGNFHGVHLLNEKLWNHDKIYIAHYIRTISIDKTHEVKKHIKFHTWCTFLFTNRRNLKGQI